MSKKIVIASAIILGGFGFYSCGKKIDDLDGGSTIATINDACPGVDAVIVNKLKHEAVIYQDGNSRILDLKPNGHQLQLVIADELPKIPTGKGPNSTICPMVTVG